MKETGGKTARAEKVPLASLFTTLKLLRGAEQNVITYKEEKN